MEELPLTVASEFLGMEDGMEDEHQGAVKRTLCPPGNMDPLCLLVLAGREKRGALRPGKSCPHSGWCPVEETRLSLRLGGDLQMGNVHDSAGFLCSW